MEELIDLFEKNISDETIKEYYKSKIMEITDRSYLHNFIFEEIIDNLKYNQSIKKLLIYEYVLYYLNTLFNGKDEILINSLKLNIQMNKIQKSCLKAMKKSINYSKINLSDMYLILEILGIIQKEVIEYSNKLLTIHEANLKNLEVLYPNDIKVDEEKMNKVYEITMNMCKKGK